MSVLCMCVSVCRWRIVSLMHVSASDKLISCSTDLTDPTDLTDQAYTCIFGDKPPHVLSIAKSKSVAGHPWFDIHKATLVPHLMTYDGCV